jgi:hypothetical protein
MSNWTDEISSLARPEYVRQPEALLTDLFWRSDGSSLKERAPKRYDKLARLIPKRSSRQSSGTTIETTPLAEQTDLAMIVAGGNSQLLVQSLLNSLIAPKSRRDKSETYVPLHPDLVALQTLSGLVNKSAPANVAEIIETVGWLGGSPVKGYMAYSLLQCLSNNSSVSQGLVYLTDAIFPTVASQTWSRLVQAYDPNADPTWIGVRASDSLIPDPTKVFSRYEYTPFKWLWNKWQILCSREWYEALPPRRFIDWATCLLRTGLAFTYLWEANFFLMLHSCARFEMESKSGHNPALDEIKAMFSNGLLLATIEPNSISSNQKHCWSVMSTLLSKGWKARKQFLEEAKVTVNNISFSDTLDVTVLVAELFQHLPNEDLKRWASPLQTDKSTANSIREFVRYLMLPRESDDDTTDQADFYYIARTNSRSLWLEPGPEWLVVITSLLSQHPGGNCTLGMLIDDLRMLGIRADRRVLVYFLEGAGLTTDSPDADNALVIRSGF